MVLELVTIHKAVNKMDNLVKAAGLDKNKKPFLHGQLRTIPFHAVNYILAGHGVFRDARTPEQSVGPGSLLILRPGLEHSFDPAPGTTWKEYWVMFDGIEAERCFGPLLPESSLCHPGLRPELESAFEELHGYVQEQQVDTPLYCAMGLHRVLGLIFRHRHGVASNFDPVVAAAVAALRKEPFAPEPDLTELARTEGVSYETLRKKFQRQIGRPPHEYYLTLKLDAAKNLLLHGLNVKEAAAAAGFTDQYYFSRLFKRHTGLSPSAFSPTSTGKP
jgi:AraC-like DNA-binding protein